MVLSKRINVLAPLRTGCGRPAEIVAFLLFATALGGSVPVRAAEWMPGNPTVPGTYPGSATFDLNGDGIFDFRIDHQGGAGGDTFAITPLSDGLQMVNAVYASAGDAMRFETRDDILTIPGPPLPVTTNSVDVPASFLNNPGYVGVIIDFHSWLPEPDRDYYGYFRVETTAAGLVISDCGFRSGPQGAVGEIEGVTSVWLSVATPNPMFDASAIRFELGRAGDATLVLFNAEGKRVRSLFAGSAPSGETVALWDGRDERGNRVAAGTYFYRLSAEGRTRVGRLVVAH